MKHFISLRAYIVRANKTLAGLAQDLGISESAMNKKMNRHAPFTVDEAIRLCEILKINSRLIPDIFTEQGETHEYL